MRARLLVCCALIAAVAAPLAAQTAPVAAQAPLSAAEQAVLGLSLDKWRWMSEKKLDSLSTLFHERAFFVHMSRTMTRDQELEVIRSGNIHYKHAEIFESSVRIVDATAHVLHRIRLDAVVGGNEVSNPFSVTEVYVRQGNVWKLTALAFSRLSS
jgi:hypothetical protein